MIIHVYLEGKDQPQEARKQLFLNLKKKLLGKNSPKLHRPPQRSCKYCRCSTNTYKKFRRKKLQAVRLLELRHLEEPRLLLKGNLLTKETPRRRKRPTYPIPPKQKSSTL